VLQLLIVCAGGALGSGARHLVATWAARTLGADFPRGTLIVNVAGSFLLGAVIAALASRPGSADLRLFLAAGVMGGFTTYSSFSAETLALAGEGRVVAAAGYVAVTLLAGLAAGALGLLAGRALAG
jgi:fluoride exporter